LRSLLWSFLCLWSQRGGISLTSSVRYVLSITTTLSNPMQTAADVWPRRRLETNPLCRARLSAVVWSQHSSRWHKQLCGWFLLPCLESVQTVVLCRFWLQCCRGLTLNYSTELLLHRKYWYATLNPLYSIGLIIRLCVILEH
jgi:hypothetical protein